MTSYFELAFLLLASTLSSLEKSLISVRVVLFCCYSIEFYVVKDLTHPASITTVVSKFPRAVNNLLDWEIDFNVSQLERSLNIWNCSMGIAGSTITLISDWRYNLSFSPVNIHFRAKPKSSKQGVTLGFLRDHKMLYRFHLCIQKKTLYFLECVWSILIIELHGKFADRIGVMAVDYSSVFLFDKLPVLLLIFEIIWESKLQ